VRPTTIFQQLLDFLEEAQLDRVGCFAYSPVEGAAANALPGAVSVPEELKQERLSIFMETQADISAARLALKIDRKLKVLVEEVDEEGAHARSYADAPEIDGMVHIVDGDNLQPGEFAEVLITDSDEHDLWARMA